MLVHASSHYIWKPVGPLMAYCSRCDAVATQRCEELRRQTRLNFILPLFSLRAGVRYVCLCGEHRCGDVSVLKQLRDLPQRSAVVPGQSHVIAINSEGALRGHADRVIAGRVRPDDRCFLLKQAMYRFWQRRLSRPVQMRLPARSWPLLIAWVFVACFALMWISPFAKAKPADFIAAGCVAAVALALAIWWYLVISAEETRQLGADSEELVTMTEVLGADQIDLSDAYRALKSCGFEGLSPIKAERIWRRVQRRKTETPSTRVRHEESRSIRS